MSYIESIAKARDLEMLNREMIVCERMGTDKQKITIGDIYVLSQKKFSLPACIIIPGKLHFVEAEMIEMLKRKI